MPESGRWKAIKVTDGPAAGGVAGTPEPRGADVPTDAPPSHGPERGAATIRGLRESRVRLIISIPCLLLLMTLSIGVICYQTMTDLSGILSPTNLEKLSRAGELLRVQHSLDSAAVRVFWMSLGVALASGVAGWILAVEIVRPIRQLTESVRRAAMGQPDRGGRSLSRSFPGPAELADLGITMNQMAQNIQRLFNERNRLLEGGAETMVLWLDVSGRIKSVDATSKSFFGRAAADLVGQDLLKVLPATPTNELFRTLLAEELSKGSIGGRLTGLLSGRKTGEGSRPGGGSSAQTRTAIVEAQFEAGDRATSTLVGVTLAPMQDAMGSPMGLLLTIRNLGQLRGFHENISRADRLAALGTFAAGMAHEIRNPLASIKGMVQLLGEDSAGNGDSMRQQAYVERILQNISRMEALIAEVMEFAHPEALPAQIMDLTGVVDEALDMAANRSLPQNRGVRVERRFKGPAPCLVEPRRLNQALVNLMTNAFEATPDHGRVVIQVSRDNDERYVDRPLVVSVSNTGSSIPPEFREKIFEPFFTTKEKGTGLGLPITLQIVAAHGGLLEADSQQGMTTFRVRLPEEGGVAADGGRRG